MVRHQEENGGWLEMADHAAFAVEEERLRPVRSNGLDVYTCGPWCQGLVLAQSMGMLDGLDLASLGHNSPRYIHLLTEVLKLAYADRHAFVGDPAFNDVPYRTMVSPEYLAERRKRIELHEASPGMPEPGGAGAFASPRASPAEARDDLDHLDTSYVCVVDAAGNTFSATPSDGSSTGPVVPGLGFVPSTRGVQSWTEAGMPAVVGPGRRPRLTPNPVIVHKPGSFVQPIGSPGNDVQPQAILQVLLNMHVFGMTPLEAVEAPRFATFSYPRSSAPHSYDPGLLKLESRIDPTTVAALQDLGHDARSRPAWEWTAGAVCTIRADEVGGPMEGAADPRRPGAVAGW